MSALENSVQSLANALDSLEAKLATTQQDREQNDTDSEDLLNSAKRQARVARAQTSKAANEIAASIDDIKTMLAALKSHR